MMRKFAAALLATALIAGPAFAASATGNSNTPAAAQTVKPAKTAKSAAAKTHDARKHHRYAARHHRSGEIASVNHIKRHNRHGHYMAHIAKPLKTDKVGKSDKS